MAQQPTPAAGSGIQAIATHEKDRTHFLMGPGRYGDSKSPLVGYEKVGAGLTVFDRSGNEFGQNIQLALDSSPFSLHLHISPQEARVLAQALFNAADRLDELVQQAAQQIADAASVHQVELHEAPHTIAVVRPINRKRATPLDVKLYALGRGITVHAERSDLAGREGAFELEANGQFFAFDPSQACVTQGFVSAIERDVAAISLKLQAKNSEDPTQGRAADGHWHCSQKTAIVSLPSAMGKTTMALALAKQLGLSMVVDDWSPKLTLMPGALHLTSEEVPA